MKKNNLKKIEEIFNAAENALTDITIGEDEKVIDGTTKAITVTAEVQYDVEEKIEDDELTLTESGDIFSLAELKKDFILTKRSLQKLTLQLQTFMEGINTLDIEEISGIKLSAVAALGTVVNQTLMNMMEIYKAIAEIEKAKKGEIGGINTMVSGDLHQNIIYAGNSSDLLKHMSKKDENI